MRGCFTISATSARNTGRTSGCKSIALIYTLLLSWSSFVRFTQMPVLRTQPSDITRLARISATYTPDPEKKSRTFVAPLKQDIGTITKAQLTGTGSVLATPTWTSPNFVGGRIFRL